MIGVVVWGSVVVSGCDLGGCLGDLFGCVIGDLAFFDHIEHVGLMLCMEQLQEQALKFSNLVLRHFFQKTLGRRKSLQPRPRLPPDDTAAV